MKLNKINSKLALLVMAVTAITCLSSCNGKSTDIDDLSVRTASGKNGVVAAANPYAANAGLEVLEAGGNAFDAAVAVSFALGVCEPHCSSIGGGGILVGYDATNKEFVSYNFREFVPEKGNISAYSTTKKLNGADSTDVNAISEWEDGVRSIGVPTQVASLLTVLDNNGNFKNTKEGRQAVIGPAQKLASEGFKVTTELNNAIASEACWKTDDQARKIFGQNGKRTALGIGETMTNANLANVYGKIIDQGKDGFYKGEVAEAILACAGVDSEENEWGHKGLITQDDLDYAVENYPYVCEPTKGTYEGYDIVSSAPPSSGGLILVEALNMLEVYNDEYGKLTDLGHNSPEYINVLSTATQLAYGDKQKWVGDDKFTDVPKDGMVNKAYAKARFTENYTKGKQYNGKYSAKVEESDGGINDTNHNVKGLSSIKGGTVDGQNYGRADWYDSTEKFASTYKEELVTCEPTDNDEHYSTTSFSCADKDGNVVTITQTINHFFGSHIMPENCGFYLNNQLSSFSTSSTSASKFVPYKNPTSHIMPTIILKDGKAVATLGSPGSMRLVSAVFQTVVNMIEWTYKNGKWKARDKDSSPDLVLQPSIDGGRLYSYCVSTSDCGSGDKPDEDHKALYLEVQSDNESLQGAECKKSDITQETADTLKNEYGYDVVVYEGRNLFFGGVQGITFDSKGVMHGGADIRRDGKAFGY